MFFVAASCRHPAGGHVDVRRPPPRRPPHASQLRAVDSAIAGRAAGGQGWPARGICNVDAPAEADVERLRFKAATQLAEIGTKIRDGHPAKSELAKTSAVADERAAKVEGLAGTIEEASVNAKHMWPHWRRQIEQHKLQIDRLMQHIEDIAHQRFDESMATLAMTRELEAGAARIADLERTLGNRDVSLLQRDAK